MSDPERSGGYEVPRQAAVLRKLVDGVPAMLAYWDANQRCRFANRAYENWFGVDPETLVGKHMTELLGPLYVPNHPYIEGALGGKEQLFEREIPDPAGGPPRHSQAHYVPDIIDGTVRGFCVLVADITQRKQVEDALREAERQLRAAERHAAMATLAAGIAHEINNPLASVLANVELALESMERAESDPELLKAALSDARGGAKRIRDIVQSMKLLAQEDTTHRELVDVADAIERSIRLASNTVRYRARLVRDLHGSDHVDANATQLTEVFVNLLVNAAQAPPESTAHRNEIRVSTRRRGSEVVIEVADNGSGIPGELHSRIFDPFFTTKGPGGGAGLGLSVSSGIVTAIGGTHLHQRRRTRRRVPRRPPCRRAIGDATRGDAGAGAGARALTPRTTPHPPTSAGHRR